MHDHPELIQHYVEVASEADNAMYEVLCQSPVQILNFGENIDATMDPPPIWSEHLVPYYCQRVEQLQAAGKFVHIECVKHVVELFYPRLVLGISDEIPPDGDIERVRLVSELVQELV